MHAPRMAACVALLLPVHVLAYGPNNKELLLHGERHTATNFLGTLLAENFGANACPQPHGMCCDSCSLALECPAGVNEPTDTTFCCWKHGYANNDCPYSGRTFHDYPVGVHLARSPYPWLLSMYMEPYEYFGNVSTMTFSEFIRAPFNYAPDVNEYQGVQDTNDHPVQLWNQKVHNLTAWPDGPYTRPMVNITHEALYDILTVDRALLPLTHMGFNLTMGNNHARYPLFCQETAFIRCDDKFGNTGQSQDHFNAAKVYEESNEWRAMYNQDDLDFVNSHLRAHLMHLWGFEIFHHALPREQQVAPTRDALTPPASPPLPPSIPPIGEMVGGSVLNSSEYEGGSVPERGVVHERQLSDHARRRRHRSALEEESRLLPTVLPAADSVHGGGPRRDEHLVAYHRRMLTFLK